MSSYRHFRPSQSRKWITALWMINSWQTITRRGCVGKAWKPPSSRPILLYFEFKGRPSLITVICMDPHSPNKLIATKYCLLILGDDTRFFFLIISLFFFSFLFFIILCYFVIINFHKNYFIIIILLLFFFMRIIFYFFMFRDIPGFSVPACSVFRVLSTPINETRLHTIFQIRREPLISRIKDTIRLKFWKNSMVYRVESLFKV